MIFDWSKCEHCEHCLGLLEEDSTLYVKCAVHGKRPALSAAIVSNPRNRCRDYSSKGLTWVLDMETWEWSKKE